MKKLEILQLFRNLNTLGQLQGVKFAYGVSRNLAILKPEIEALEKASSPTPEFLEMDKKRIKLVEEHAEKDEGGKPKKKGNEYVIPEDKQKDFENAFEAFKLEHKELFDAREKQIEEYNALLQTESEVKLHKVNLADVPEKISVQQMHSISSFVEDSIPSPFQGK